jgi:type IV secretory pathway TrbL component
MKTVLVVAACLILALSGLAFAGVAKDNTGCGLGSVVFENKADGSSVSQAFQATTNGTSGNQTFGISSGTSDCKQPASFVQNEQLKSFVRSNMDNLAKETAQGRGESLDTLAELMQITPAQKGQFVANLQTSFSSIYSSPKVELADVVDGIVTASKIS